MKEAQPRAIHLKDYAPPAFRVETIDLDVDIREDHALVAAKLEVRRNTAGPLVLDGDELELVSVALNGSPVLLVSTGTNPTPRTMRRNDRRVKNRRWVASRMPRWS